MAGVTLELVPNHGESIYYAGETIKGTLTMLLSRETKCKNLSVKLLGEANVSFLEEWRKKTTFHNEKYLDRTTKFFHYENAIVMLPGCYKYDFSFVLPECLPRSHTYKITYQIKGILNIPWTFLKTATQHFELKRHDDLNLYPILYLPRMKQKDANFFSFTFKCGGEGVCRLTAFLPYSGFISGQIMKFIIKYENLSNVKIKSTKVELRETELERYDERDMSNKYSTSINKETFDGVNARSIKEVSCEMVIPLDTSQSDFLYSTALTIRHSIQITAKTEGMHFNPKFMIPIVIGSEPLVNIGSMRRDIVGIDSPAMRSHLAMDSF